MAAEKKVTFPKLTTKNWWALRDKFKQTIPANVTDSYISSMLNMTTDSAKANIIPPLKQVGIIDKNGKTTDRAKKWRDDHEYAKVCEEMRREVYPQELLDIFSDSNIDVAMLKRWFMNHLGVGESAGGMMAGFYILLAEADPAKRDDGSKAKSTGTAPRTSRTTKPATPKVKKGESLPEPTIPNNPVVHLSPGMPSVHIDLQIHISPDTSAEQIEKIFASMAKHFR